MSPVDPGAVLGSSQVGIPVHTLAQARVLPVVTLRNPEAAVPLAHALLGAGISAMEITLREAGALDAIESVSMLVPEMTVAVGTVRTALDLRQAANAGARFGLSPASPRDLLLGDHPIPLIPGVSTPTEARRAWGQGYRLQKLFPSELLGGPAWLQTVAGPLPDITFIPTGGIDGFNASVYLDLPNVLCVGGSFVVPAELLHGQKGVDQTLIEASITQTMATLDREFE